IFIPYLNNRKQVSLVEAILASSVAITPIIIVKAATILEGWIIDLLDNYLIYKSETRYSNNKTSLD
ncbi:uncharacterized protein K441DRAFT_573763, partial [Cenococcum geophilum 1.58]|uniref:uncharacterized protein n=1 Tax=Cenococcum geophilum 1.58 TaxID=794803 RepID=UPI00358DF7AE